MPLFRFWRLIPPPIKHPDRSIFNLEKLKVAPMSTHSYCQRVLIEKMLSTDPSKRPTTSQLLAHPIVWSKSKTLQFLQDVSDRIERIEADDPILLAVEKNADQAIKNNWKSLLVL